MKNLYIRYAVKILLVFFFFVSSNATVFATVYYVSSSGGNDGRTLLEAKNAITPWRTIEKVNSIMGNLQAGDQILFKRGDIFPGMLTVNISGGSGNPVVFGAYGDGALPELTGFVTLSGWQQKGGNVWETAVPSGLSYLNTVTINGAAKAVGRYPNATAANQGYLSYDSFNTNVSITDSKLAGQDWSGGQVVMRKTRWIIDRSAISSQSGTTLSYNSPTGYWGAKGYGYFIQNHPNTLDTEGEWYYQSGRIGIFTAGNPSSSTVRAGVIETIVRIANQRNLTFENLRLSGAAVSAFEINSSQNIRINGCEILFSGRNGLNATGTDGLTVENSTIAHTNSNALSVNGGNNTALRGNQIRNSGTYAGMGDAGDGSCEGITIGGDNNTIANNTIDSTGYVPLNFSGNNVTIKNNVVTNFALTKDDGGGIYTWNNGSNAPVNTGRVITGNIVLNGIGAPGGTDNPNKAYAHGIYIDDNASQIEISGNTVGNCATYGMFIHNAHDIAIKQNTLYNNAVQLEMEHDNVAADKPIYNCTVTGNVFFAKQASQLSAEYKTKDNDIANFGSFDNNYYYRPLDDDLVIGVLQQVNGVYIYKNLSVESWKALYGKDAGSVKSGHSIPAYVVTKVTGSNQFSNGAFESNAGGLYAYASANNCVTGWDNGHLDGGALKVSFSSTSNSANYGSVIIGVGAVTAGKSYRLKFSMLGSSGSKAITAYLRQSGGSYSDLSERKAATITGIRQEKEFLFTATASEGNASIVFDVPEQPSPLYLDNIRLEQVEATLTNPDQYISFLYNTTTSTKSYSTSQSYDAAGTSYPNSIKLNAFSSAVLVQDTAPTVTTSVETNKCSSTGTILREQWDSVAGTGIADIPLQKTPSSTSQLTSFEGPKDITDNYGSRIRGYICPPQTGNYTFWIASDDAGELWLSTDDQPGNKVRIATVSGYTDYREWTRYSSQKSVQIQLQAGQKYYIEALQKDGGGGDHLSVQWQLPDATMETPIAGSHLSPYVSTAVTTPVVSGTGSITRDQWNDVGGNNIADIPLQKIPSSTGTITSFEGPKDITDNYGSRIRGYIFPPQTGSYTFWMASDDAGELWLSSDDQPANKTKIATVSGYTDYREWTRYSSQKSVQITLQAGQKYYIEALQKDGIGGDHLSVQWQLPDATMETPIAGSHLSPYVADAIAEQTISFAAIASKTVGDAPFALTATASSGLPVSFSIVSGSATISGSTVTLTGDGNVTIAANQLGNASFSAAKTVTQSFAVVPASTACSATGTILREIWSSVSGNNLSDFSFQSTPTSTSQLTFFEGPTNVGDNYASRIRGYICAPQTGNYTFWLAGDDAAELYISTDDNPSNKVRIANLLSWTSFREWNKFASQKSNAITLQTGKKYYIEVLHKQGGGGDNLSVQWQLPDGAVESPLPGKYLSPYQAGQLSTSSLSFSSSNAVNSPSAITLTEPLSVAVKQGLYIFPNPVSQQSNVEFMLTESGQTNVALYSTKGQLVSKLFTGATQANTKKSFVLDAGTLQNGVYLLRLTSGKNSLTKKVIVLK
ncbi:MAG: PA14 domain-containing protein [Janthinobacterium lividum]